MAKKVKEFVLPNPRAKREQCVHGLCDGCGKMFSDSNLGDVCIIYESPKAWKRKGDCPMKTNKPVQAEVKVKVNPLKASKRALRKEEAKARKGKKRKK